MKIGDIAQATGISRDTLRFYEKRGLLTARRSGNGYRDYPPEAVQWLTYIRTAQSLGFTLAEIEADLPLLADPGGSPEAIRAALRTKLGEIDRRIEGLAALRADLAARLDDAGDCPLRPAAGAATMNDAVAPRSGTGS
ncbi:MerR family transcriptional regulator [Pseudoduganella sp. SL102]|uniref:MerR family transcriptional regulator n=1 Tax=Pseudoduganella sp. SL102 TaxID=2995154 RepID=UPI00248BA71E|nr:MerR family transcriptional regulator [Pseudoduganella sp. SL102]WBS01298.1 MerR family transcriptional regulator [Pseudoduganella sp. SL102]